MYLPDLYEGNLETVQTTTFLGYNHNPIIADGEMYDMKNLSSGKFPLLSVRNKRYVQSYGNSTMSGIHGRDQLVLVQGEQVYWGFAPVPGLTVSAQPSMCPKKIVSMGAYVCIWPDKVYFNTIDLRDCGSMERLYSVDGSSVSAVMCRGDGTNYDFSQIYIGSEAPSSPSNGMLWMDTSAEKNILKQYYTSTGEWSLVESTYVKLSANGIGANLKEYDVVDLTGMVANSTNVRVLDEVNTLNTSMIVYQRSDNYIVVAGFLSQPTSMQAGTVRADLKVPDLDFIVESNNRLWGCKYGLENGVVVNEIRACKLGDFRNWQCFMGLSSDSYAASCGTDGAWTGAVTQLNYPVFFKEGCIHRVSGSMPANFQITTTMCRGVQDGSWRSVCVVNEAIYYKSRQDIMMYDGSMPVSVSAQLGGLLYSNARAGSLHNKYYISMVDADGEWHQFVYDIEKQLWHKEDNFQAYGYGAVSDTLYAIDEQSNSLVQLIGTGGEGWEQEEDFEWEAVFGLFGTDYVNQKYLSRFNIRMSLGKKSTAGLWIRYDEEKDWHFEGAIKVPAMSTFMIPVVPRRCDHLQFKIAGTGSVNIYSLARILEVGGDG